MGQDITLDEAQAVISAAQAKAQEIGGAFNIAVHDAGNNLKAFLRQDGAWLGSIDIAQAKAYTARAFDMPTKALTPLAQPGELLYGMDSGNNGGRLVIIAGGIPLKRGDVVVGAIGVSGSTPDQDELVADAGVAAFAAAVVSA